MNATSSAEITIRNDIARDIIAGFAAVTPALAGVFRLIDAALADLPAVLTAHRQTQNSNVSRHAVRAGLLYLLSRS